MSNPIEFGANSEVIEGTLWLFLVLIRTLEPHLDSRDGIVVITQCPLKCVALSSSSPTESCCISALVDNFLSNSSMAESSLSFKIIAVDTHSQFLSSTVGTNKLRICKISHNSTIMSDCCSLKR